MKPNILIYTLLLSFLVTQISYAQRTFSADSEREIIVQFTEDALTSKNEVASGRLSDFTINSNPLKYTLDSVGVETISKLFPEFKKEDRFAETKNGKKVRLSDWSNAMVLKIPQNASREELIKKLERLPEVVYAEANIVGSNEGNIITTYHEPSLKSSASMPTTPNDQYFYKQWSLKNTGSAAQGNGTPDADIDADQAWDISTGSSSVKIAIMDQGVDNDHDDFNSNLSGDPNNVFQSDHGTAVAGIAAAKANNSDGIA